MQIGVSIFPTDYGVSMRELARAAEDRGYESLLVAEHTHIPVSRRSPWAGGPELPRQYWHTLDPFVALTEAAVVTERLLVGTGICLLIERDPIVTAKEVASVDHVSGGRFLFGIGGGWNKEEMEDHGTDPAGRWKLLRERVEAMMALWTEEEPEYHGELVSFDRCWSWPKPVQKPHPPVLLGGNGPNTLRRVVAYADGWMPNRGDALARIPELQRMAAEAGRDPIPVTWYPKRERASLEEAQRAGVARVLYWLPNEDRTEALRSLDELTALVEPFMARG